MKIQSVSKLCFAVISVLPTLALSSEDASIREEIRSVSENSRVLWESGGCQWSEKHYSELSPELFEAIKNGSLSSQLPAIALNKDAVGEKINYSQIVDYLDRYLSPSYSCAFDLYYNKEGWRIDEYTDVSRLSPNSSEIAYKNSGLAIQGMRTTIQFGDKRWRRNPHDLNYNIVQGVQINPGKNIPTALGDVLPMLFVDNIFMDIPGRNTSVTKREDGVYFLKASHNEGITEMVMRTSVGVLFMDGQQTKVSGKLVKIGGEYGKVLTTGALSKPNMAVPQFTVDVTYIGSINKINIIVREIEAFKCENVTNEFIMRPLSEAVDK